MDKLSLSALNQTQIISDFECIEHTKKGASTINNAAMWAF